MKILVAMHYAPPHIGGMEAVVEKQTASLHAYGHDVTLITLKHNRNLKTQEQLPTHRVRRFAALNFIENKFGITFPLVSPFSIFGINREVGKADIIHIHDVFYLLSHITATIATIRKKPIYLTQHVALVDHPNRFVMAVQKFMYHTIGIFILRKAKAVIVYNVNVKNFLVGLGVDKSKILQIHNGIDINAFSPGPTKLKKSLRARYNIPQQKPVVLFVGRLVHKKGFDLVASAGSKAYTILIVGTGKIPARYKNMRNVIFFGPATRNQLIDIYHLSDIFVFPAVGEIFTLAMQEAMACGLPVITTNDTAYQSYNINYELIGFTKREVSAIKLNIKQLLSVGALYQKMSAYSRALALERFNWNKNYKEELAIYNQAKHAL